jgi:16S rRNA (guanine527-N7)-methyltransferase
MNENQIQILNQQLNIAIPNNEFGIWSEYEKLFLQENFITNLISKNDEKFLFEKHIFDSLAIELFFQKYSLKHTAKLLDIGTGGGFPSVPVSIFYKNLDVFALDSIRKKINIINKFKTGLNLDNLFPLCDRVENLKNNIKYDYITTRAVAPLETILKYAFSPLKSQGYFIAYKSKKALDEIRDAQKIVKSLNFELIDIIEYTLPLEEIHERNLIIFKKN